MEGIRDPLVVWERETGDMILLDGHNRWKISTQHGGIPFNIVKKHFGSREEALIWIIQNQFGRRNLSAYDRSVLALKLKPVIAKKAKEKETERKTTYQKSEKSSLPKCDTAKELAKIAGVSHDTIHKVEAIEKSEDPRIIEGVRSGDMSINEGFGIIRARTTKTPAQMKKEHIEEARETHDRVQANPIVSITDAKADQEARKTLAVDLWRRCLNMGKQIEAIHIEASEGDVDLGMMARELTDDDYQILLHTIATIEAALTYIKKGIIR